MSVHFVIGLMLHLYVPITQVEYTFNQKNSNKSS